MSLSYYEPATATATVMVEHDGRYRLILELTANERYVDGQNDYNRCQLVLRADGEELLRREFVRQDNKPFRFEFDRDWKAGPHTLAVEVQPLTPDQKQVRSLSIRVQSVTVRGPMDERYWVRPAEYERFFPGRGSRRCRRAQALCSRDPRPVRRAGVSAPGGRCHEGSAGGAGRRLSRPELGGRSRPESRRRWRPS